MLEIGTLSIGVIAGSLITIVTKHFLAKDRDTAKAIMAIKQKFSEVFSKEIVYIKRNSRPTDTTFAKALEEQIVAAALLRQNLNFFKLKGFDFTWNKYEKNTENNTLKNVPGGIDFCGNIGHKNASEAICLINKLLKYSKIR